MKKRINFTLIELLVVMAIIAILASILLPALGRSRAAGRRIACTNQMRQLYLGVATYANSFSDYMPPFHSSYTFRFSISYLCQDTLPALASNIHWTAKPDATGYVCGISFKKPVGLFFCPEVANGAGSSPYSISGNPAAYFSSYAYTASMNDPEIRGEGGYFSYKTPLDPSNKFKKMT